jgi:hypothetical protein
VVDDSDDAKLLATSGGDDGDRRTTASSMVVVARRMGWWPHAGAWLEREVSAASREEIPAAWSRALRGVWVWRERGWMGTYRRAGVG